MGIVVVLSEIQWSIRYAQDDESRGGAEECGRALLDTLPGVGAGLEGGDAFFYY